jgi:hypothetical protein
MTNDQKKERRQELFQKNIKEVRKMGSASHFTAYLFYRCDVTVSPETLRSGRVSSAKVKKHTR